MKSSPQISLPFGKPIKQLADEMEEEITANTRSEIFLQHLAVLHSTVSDLQSTVNKIDRDLAAHVKLEAVNCNSVVELEQNIKIINANIESIIKILGQMKIGETQQEIDLVSIKEALKPQLSKSSNRTLGFAGLISFIVPVIVEIIKAIAK